MPVLAFQDFTNAFTWAISLFHSSTGHSPTPPPGPQKWPLKWVPISLPSSHAPRSWATVSLMPWMSLKPMSELPGVCRGRYSSRFPSGSRYTPLRKYVIVALLALATARKWENSFCESSPAPSQEKTTNCGGFRPGPSLSGLGW